MVSSQSEEAVVLRLEANGAGEITAGQFSPNADVEIHNPDLVLATISGSGELGMDVTIQRGRGYVSAEGNKEANNSTTQIAVDSIFSPVRRVTFSVEPTRVEQSNDFDSLILEIETDGSMTPGDAFASVGGTLGNLDRKSVV